MRCSLAKLVVLAGVASSTLFMTGCAVLERSIANTAVYQVEEKVAPQIIRGDDLNMGCTSTVALTPLISGLRGFHADPTLLESIMLISDGICADEHAVQEELRYLRAVYEKRPDEAQDARIAQKRWLERTTRRQLASFEKMRGYIEKKYFVKYGEQCPVFSREVDELDFLLGTVAGLQAVQNDIAAQQIVGVSMDIAPKAAAAAACLSASKWWGVPLATQALVWSMIPGASEGKDINATYNTAMALGEREGVRIAHVMAAITASAADNKDGLKNIIRRFATAPHYHPNPKYRFLDEIAIGLMQSMSDRLWTQYTGARTPINSLGKFWDDKVVGADIDVEGFLGEPDSTSSSAVEPVAPADESTTATENQPAAKQTHPQPSQPEAKKTPKPKSTEDKLSR